LTERTLSTRPNGGASLCSRAKQPVSHSGAPAASEKKPPQLPFTIENNWPDTIPVTDREIEVIETYMGDVLDAILAQCRLDR